MLCKELDVAVGGNMTKDEFTQKMTELLEHANRIGVTPKVVDSSEFDYCAEKEKIYKAYIKALEDEISRVAGFLAVHNFPGYEFDDAAKDTLGIQTITYTTACSES